MTALLRWLMPQLKQSRCGHRQFSRAGHLNHDDSDNGKGRRHQMAYTERGVSVPLISFALFGIQDEELPNRNEHHHRVLYGINKGSPGHGQ